MSLSGESYPIRRAASLFSQQSEMIRTSKKQLKSNTAQLFQGPLAWKGTAAQAYEEMMQLTDSDLDIWVSAYQRTSSALYLLADRLDALNGMRHRLAQLEDEIYWMSQQNPEGCGSLFSETSNLRARIQEEERQTNNDLTREFQAILYSIPNAHTLGDHIQQIANSRFFGNGNAPSVVGVQSVRYQGEQLVEYLNDTILMNQSVIDYYNDHPEAVGPHGESAEEMKALAFQNQEEARRRGGTHGVPVVFMHGLEGGVGTFKTMADDFGGASIIYTYTRDGKVNVEYGENQSTDRPVVQFVFEDGSMTFENQEKAYELMAARAEADAHTKHMIVVSHSMGGIVSTKYILDTGGEDVSKLVTLASPIGGSKVDEYAMVGMDFTPGGILGNAVIGKWFPAINNLRSDSNPIHELYKDRTDFNPDTQVFSAGGRAYGPFGDGVVLPDSAAKLKEFTSDDQFSWKMYDELNHSDMHEDPEVREDVYQYVYEGKVPQDERKK
ncbi:alpha/beta hydrolase [Tumebacillus flagellatus]|uniref:Uncharacterized protein n=1 Tax=Tumebacillus flagellatus TaxID=1157490 RepID=A0A074LSJ7_9BACL|nr:alpha/beta hydrolase [Tumebacillus flagellatus]KEO82768.1 hypothetical protein EL26_13545 [Tumebacillus flagellatus]